MPRDVIIPTYTIQVSLVGGSGPQGSPKDMVSMMNPSASGKKLKVRGLLIQPEENAGTSVIVLYELRRITAQSGGDAFTPLKRDSLYPDSVAAVYTEPSSVTGDTNIHSFILQANTVQGVMLHSFGQYGETPIVLNEGEGLNVHQVTSNAGQFHITVVWTEETKQ
jgi:hypothetical protein